MNAPTPAPSALTVVALQNVDILRAFAGGPLADLKAVAAASGRDSKNLARQLDLLHRDGLVTHDKPFDLTDAGRRALHAIDVANGAAVAEGGGATDVMMLAHHELRPNPLQPRKRIDEAELEALAATIHDAGDVLQNLVVFPPDNDGVHDIAAGERRWRAVGLLIERGLWPTDRRLRAIQRERSAGQVSYLALVENGQRANLTLIEEARAYAELIAETGWSAREAALRTGRDPRTVQEMTKVLREASPEDIALHEAGGPDHTWEWLRNAVKVPKPAEPEPHQIDVEEVAPPRPAHMAYLDAPEPQGEDRAELLKTALAELHEYDAAIRRGDTNAACAAAERYDQVVYAFNGGEASGSAAPREGRPSATDVVAAALAAPDGEPPMYGQQGLFMIDINGMPVVVAARGRPSRYTPGGDVELHVHDLNAPFLSDTGYRSCLGLRGRATLCEVVTRHIVGLINTKDHRPRLVEQQHAPWLEAKIAERPQLPLLQVPESWLVFDDPLVVNGRRFPNLTRANEARRIAEGGGPRNSGGGGKRDAAPAPTAAPAQLRELTPLERLAMLELAMKLANGDDGYDGAVTGERWTQVRKYWLDASFARLANDLRLIKVSHVFPNGPHAAMTDQGQAWADEQDLTDEALEDANEAAGWPRELIAEYRTPWLNVVDEPASAAPAPQDHDADELVDEVADRKAREALYCVSEEIERSDDFSRADLFDRVGVRFPLTAGTGDELGVIFDASGAPFFTVDSDGQEHPDLVQARVLLVMATLNAVVAETEAAFVIADVKLASEEERKPAVPIRRSITPDHITCLEDGRKFLSLTQHLRAAYGLEPDAYRHRWGLPRDYPMVAPNYAAARHRSVRSLLVERPYAEDDE